jgi:hypothetical protein
MPKGECYTHGCIYCGRFLSLESDDVDMSFTPDSEYSVESFEVWHKRCEEKSRQETRMRVANERS